MGTKISQPVDENKIKELIEVLGDQDGQKRKNAREKLVDIGEDSLHHIKDLLNHSKHIYRWEAMKVIKDIGAPKSIPVLLDALDDEKSDIRWIAAEGLINSGSSAVIPLLKHVTENYDSVFVLNGAHHVISELEERNLLPVDFPTKELLSLLKNSSKESSLKVMVHKILSELD
jgi:HEAT repeat protein